MRHRHLSYTSIPCNIYSGFICVNTASLTPGKASIAESFHCPSCRSEARPVKAIDPVNEFVTETPVGFLMYADGNDRLDKSAEFHRQMPCPNLALKSPTTTFPKA